MSRDRYGSQYTSVIRPRRYSGNEHGIALLIALMFLVVLALLTATANTVTTLASQISGNYKASIRSFQSAEAGAEEARARLRAWPVDGYRIYDYTVYDNAVLPQPPWQTYIGSATDAQVYGYTTGNTQTRVDSLQTAPPYTYYTVKIEHATNAGGQMLYWGSPTGTGVNIRNTTLTGNPIYLVTSHGAAGGANGIVQTQVARVPPVVPPGALYVRDTTRLLGHSTYINGNDACGTRNLPGVTTDLDTTTGSEQTIEQAGYPQVLGTPVPIQYLGPTLNVQAMVDSLKDGADFSYTYSANTTLAHQGYDPSWGTPTTGATQESALACAGSEPHVVYFNMEDRLLHLSGGTKGCGFLLVQGDLEVTGDFSWYGPVLVTGLVNYSGGGYKNISGALISGGRTTVTIDDDIVGGNATIVNCSEAITNAVWNLPLRVLNWTQT